MEQSYILTFDIEEWYILQFHGQGSVDEYAGRYDVLLDRVLDDLGKRGIKATFFCLGKLAKQFPSVVRRIAEAGHEIACHSNEHRWLTDLSEKEFYEDTYEALASIEDITGEKVKGYRAPAFSIGSRNKWALNILSEMGIEYDCSIFPASRDFGGFPEFSEDKPVIVSYRGTEMKELPINVTRVLGRDVAFSGGGYFRLFPFPLLKKFIGKNNYLMTYFHMRDFDKGQKRVWNMRYFKNYYGIEGAYDKFIRLLDEYDFVSVAQAIKGIDWESVRKIEI